MLAGIAPSNSNEKMSSGPSSPKHVDLEAGQKRSNKMGNAAFETEDPADGAQKTSCCAAFCSCSSTGGSLTLIGTKIAYTVIMVVTVAVALLAKFVAPENLTIASFDMCSNDLCRGNSAAYRVSFAAAIFFLFTLIGTLASPTFHFTHWITKITVYCGAVIVCFFIPGEVFRVYAEISRVLSFFFLLLQILILLNLVHSIHETLLAKISSREEPAAGNAKAIYLTAAITLFACAITGTALLYVYYDHCKLNIGLISLCLVLGIISLIASLRCGQGILTPSLVFAYATFLSFQAVTNNPYASCGVTNSSQPIWILVVATTIAAGSLGWNALQAAESTPVLFDSAHKSPDVVPDADAAAASPRSTNGSTLASAGAGAGGDGAAQEPPRWEKAWVFHLVMILAAMYVAMLTTGWGSTSGVSSLANSEASEQSMWTKWSCQWLLYLLYFWTLAAPRLFPDRDFSSR